MAPATLGERARAALWAAEIASDRLRLETVALLDGDPSARAGALLARIAPIVTVELANERRRRLAVLAGLGVHEPEATIAERFFAACTGAIAGDYEHGSVERDLLCAATSAGEIVFAIASAELLRKVAPRAGPMRAILDEAASAAEARAIACARDCRAAIDRARPAITADRFHPSVALGLDRLRRAMDPTEAPRGPRRELAELAARLDTPAETRPTSGASEAERAAIAEILARPLDGAPRARFADLAAARGDPRAELVRLGLEASRSTRITRIEIEPARARWIVEAHPEWAEPVIALGATRARFHRGFVEAIEIDAAAFLAHADRLFEVAPILAVRFLDAARHLEELARSPALGRLVSIDLRGQRIGDAGARTLAASPSVRELVALDLRDNAITDEGVEALARSEHLAGLLACCLEGNPCEPLYRLDWTLQEMPTEEVVLSDFGAALTARTGGRRWFLRGDGGDHPPGLDVLVAHRLAAGR